MLKSSCSFGNQQLRGMRQQRTSSKAQMQGTNQDPARYPGVGKRQLATRV
jgi:hypothetical protein